MSNKKENFLLKLSELLKSTLADVTAKPAEVKAPVKAPVKVKCEDAVLKDGTKISFDKWEVGSAAYDEAGAPLADGDYEKEDGRKFSVKDGLITAIVEAPDAADETEAPMMSAELEKEIKTNLESHKTALEVKMSKEYGVKLESEKVKIQKEFDTKLSKEKETIKAEYEAKLVELAKIFKSAGVIQAPVESEKEYVEPTTALGKIEAKLNNKK